MWTRTWKIDGRSIGQELDLNKNLRDAGVNSVDFVAFMKVVVQEFDVELTVGDCEKFESLSDLIAVLEKPAA